jgi:energy-coupling factor transporter ATP-binding protein EcfA2
MRLVTLLPGLLLGVVMALVTGMWQFALFTFVSVLSVALTTLLIKRKTREPDLDYSDQPIWLSPWAVALGDKVLPRTGWFFKEQYSDIFFDYATKLVVQRDILQRSKELEESHFKTSISGDLPFWAGISESIDLQFDLVRDGPHGLIVGSTGAGKSELLKLVTGSLLVSVSKPIELVLIDFKGGAGLRELNRHPWTLTLVTDLDKDRHERFWHYLAGELKNREIVLATEGVSSITETKSLQRMIVLADEMPAIIASHPLALTTLEAIAARGRSLGVHLIATSQSLAGIPRALITNLTLRFAIGVTDPGDLISLVPTMRATSATGSRALAIWGSKTAWFDFPMSKILPNLGEGKTQPEKVLAWTAGLATSFESDGKTIAILDIPAEQRVEKIFISEFVGKSLLVVGASSSGKSMTAKLLKQAHPSATILDGPTIPDLETAYQSGQPLWCTMPSSVLLPLALQRKFEYVLYLRQSNLDQHLAAGLPKGSWNEKLPPGRGWFRGLAIQLAMPRPIQSQSTQENGQQPLVH